MQNHIIHKKNCNSYTNKKSKGVIYKCTIWLPMKEKKQAYEIFYMKKMKRTYIGVIT